MAKKKKIALQFPYHGDIAGLHEVLAPIRSDLNAAYFKVYGMKMMERIQEAERRLLTPQSFIAGNLRSRLPETDRDSTARPTNSFAMLFALEKNDLVVQRDGQFTVSPVTMSPAFSLSEEAFQATAPRYEKWASPYLVPYVHEYNHWAIAALQGTYGFSGALNLIALFLKVNKVPIEPDDIEEAACQAFGDREEKRLRVYMGLLAFVLYNTWEISTRKLDIEVLKALGLNVPPDYCPINTKNFVCFPMQRFKMDAFFPIGDLMHDFDGKARLRAMTNWIPAAKNDRYPSMQKFLESYQAAEIRIVTVDEMISEAPCDERERLAQIIGRPLE